MRALALALLVTTACHGGQGRGRGPSEPTNSPPPLPAPATMSNPVSSPDPIVCTSLSCLQQHEGEQVDVQGIYEFPKAVAFAVHRLRLGDGTTIVLPPSEEGGDGPFSSSNDGKPMRLRGRVFTGPIPPEYRIVGRTKEPYLVDLERVTRVE